MMFLSAANHFPNLTKNYIAPLDGIIQTSDRENVLKQWKRVSNGTVTFFIKGSEPIMAIDISLDGYFLSHENLDSISKVNQKSVVDGKTYAGDSFQVVRVKHDLLSGLTLWKLTGKAIPHIDTLSISTASPKPGEAVLLALSKNVFRAAVVQNNIIGSVEGVKGHILLDEISFDASPQHLSGVYFNESGEVSGILGIANDPRAQILAPNNGNAGEKISDKYGPLGLVQAFSPSVACLRQVIAGLMSPDHEIPRPFLGVNCTNAGSDGENEFGAKVSDVIPNSPAAFFGLAIDDIIIGIDKTIITSKEDYVVELLQHSAGDVVLVRFMRDGTLHNLSIKLQEGPKDTLTQAK